MLKDYQITMMKIIMAICSVGAVLAAGTGLTATIFLVISMLSGPPDRVDKCFIATHQAESDGHIISTTMIQQDLPSLEEIQNHVHFWRASASKGFQEKWKFVAISEVGC